MPPRDERPVFTVGSLCTGIGGIDLGFERAGHRIRWQSEINLNCRQLLSRIWKNVNLYGDMRSLVTGPPPEAVDIIIGGDPCPKHSRARSNGDSIHPDLCGYFLAVVGRLRPWWVVRENVPAPTVKHFAVALEHLGYGAIVVRIDGAAFTGQSRQRDFIVARRAATREQVRALFPDCANGPGPYTTRLGTRQLAPALTCHRTRYDSRDCYIWEKRSKQLRILDSQEREALAGFPPRWTAGFSEATRANMLGNAVIPEVAEWIARHLTSPAFSNRTEVN